MKKTGFLIATTAIGAILAVTSANAAGYQVKETSATQLGQAFAGSAAIKGDISAMWANPATMTSLNKHQVALSLSYIIPSAKFKEGGSSTDTTSNTGGDGGVNALVPALYAMWNLQNNFKFGIAVTSPFGLTTKYNENWRGRYHAIKSDLKIINVNPNLAYKLNEYVSLGLGISFQHAKVELTNKLSASGSDHLAKVTGTDWGAGFNVGAIFEPWKGTRFGIAYRSKISHGLTGHFETTATAFATYSASLNLDSTKTKISADMTTPETLDFSFSQDVNEAWTVMGSAVLTRWNRFNDLTIKNNGSSKGSNIKYERQGWKNVWFFALGANWKFANDWMLRFGIAYDQSPINNKYRTPKLPGSDRTWLSAGLDYKVADYATVALTYTHVFVKDGKIDNTNALSNRIQGKVKNKVDIIGLQANFKF